MSDHHKFEITLAPRGVDGRVVMDGEELKGVWSVAVSAECDGLSKVTITFNAQDVVIREEAGELSFATHRNDKCHRCERGDPLVQNNGMQGHAGEDGWWYYCPRYWPPTDPRVETPSARLLVRQ